MKPIITARQIDDLLRHGGDVRSLPADAIYTPSALDLLRDREFRTSKPSPDETPAAAATPTAISSKSSPQQIDALFRSAHCQSVKEQICDIGRRLWQREYVDGNGGNMAVKVGEDLAICTPTLVSKGFMKPDDLCLVDFSGRQLAGTKSRTSEILMHLQIMARQPRATATVHCHPPYSTAFAVVGILPPQCMVPEYELFASVALAPYRTPGTPEMGKLVADVVEHHNIVLMANHGVVSWSPNSVEEAYFKMEILEAYCRTVLVTAQLGKPPNTFTADQMRDLLKIKQNLDIPDPRLGMKDPVFCDNTTWSPGIQCAAPAPDAAEAAPTSDAGWDALIDTITERILAQLKQS